MTTDPPPAPAPPTGFALWNLGFRPFYLLAGAFAAFSIAWWVTQLTGWTGTHVYVASPLWHAHEMIFGYAFAVIVGFLFTAVRNWTNEPTPTGWPLACIAALWLTGRLSLLSPWSEIAAVSDAAFALAAAAGVAVPLFKSRNRRNYFVIVLILALGLANLAFHLAMTGAIDFPVQRGLQIGLDLVLFLMAVVGGRVIPMFTGNAVPGSNPQRNVWIERAALVGVLLLIVADLSGTSGLAVTILAGATAIAHAARLTLWRPWLTIRQPILWVLHASYAWIVVHLALRALAAVEVVPASAAAHALTVGAIGGLTLGMMTRTARGHTGRPLTAAASEIISYVLVLSSAIVRVFVPLMIPQWYVAAVAASGVLWAAAFALFVVAFWPVLLRPRVDGRSG